MARRRAGASPRASRPSSRRSPRSPRACRADSRSRRRSRSSARSRLLLVLAGNRHRHRRAVPTGPSAAIELAQREAREDVARDEDAVEIGERVVPEVEERCFHAARSRCSPRRESARDPAKGGRDRTARASAACARAGRRCRTRTRPPPRGRPQREARARSARERSVSAAARRGARRGRAATGSTRCESIRRSPRAGRFGCARRRLRRQRCGRARARPAGIAARSGTRTECRPRIAAHGAAPRRKTGRAVRRRLLPAVPPSSRRRSKVIHATPRARRDVTSRARLRAVEFSATARDSNGPARAGVVPKTRKSPTRYGSSVRSRQEDAGGDRVGDACDDCVSPMARQDSARGACP